MECVSAVWKLIILLGRAMIEVNTTTYLKNYEASPFRIKSVHLTFRLNPTNTIVIAKILFSPKKLNCHLELDGVDLNLQKVQINGLNIDLNLLSIEHHVLTVPNDLLPKDDFYWQAETIISPQTNTSLDGLYLSSGIYCTQCEAQGFRKITYFLDRPDIMSTYTVRIEGQEPVLLSNGNQISIGKGFTEWHDPWPKPSYLFALVAGNLTSLNDTFKTKTGRTVDLKIFVKPADIDKCAYAMDALKRSMRWDEEEYQREYDLDLFMIVAIDDFNMGAMENKGLNIFNSKYILADEKTATDRDYDNIERIIAHEYFHNWTGNRITCRDWFQLCLKEGLTVFRDQQFSAKMRGFPVKRIEDVLVLRGHQFREDDGPLAHSVRPEKYLEINNFYTATVYEKGAELVRMLKLIVGDECYNSAVQTYFDTFDGQACTVEDWLSVFRNKSKVDLEQFLLWYNQKGRPTVSVNVKYKRGTYVLNFEQKMFDQRAKPMLIPITVGLISDKGEEIRSNETILFSKKKQSFTFNDLPSKPIPSVLRDFSAPITLIQHLSDDELQILASHDTNLFNRWECLRNLSFKAIEKLIYDGLPISNLLLCSIDKIIRDPNIEPAYRALIATPPSPQSILNHLTAQGRSINPTVICDTWSVFNNALASECADYLSENFKRKPQVLTYEPTAEQAGTRALELRLMDLYCYIENSAEVAKHLFKTASNMTEEMGALSILIRHDKVTDEVDKFYHKWKRNNNVLDKWFSAQVSLTSPKKVISTLENLTKHDDFEIRNPNRFRSIIGAFAGNNLSGFHHVDGKGYKIVTDWLLKLDKINPQTTARICTVFENWKVFDPERQKMIKENLNRLYNLPNISKNTYEIIDSILNK